MRPPLPTERTSTLACEPSRIRPTSAFPRTNLWRSQIMRRRPHGIARTAFVLGTALLLGPAGKARADCEVAGGFQTYYVLGREDHLYSFFVAVDQGEAGTNPVIQNAMESVVTMTAT